MPLSSKQLEYLSLAWQCFENEPKIDYEKFKTIAGLASAASARELMRVTKKKLKEEYGALGGGMQATDAETPKKKNGSGTSSTPASTPAKRGRGGGRKPAGKKAAAELNGGNDDDPEGDMEEDDGDHEPELTPTAKKAKMTAAKKMVVKEEPDIDADGEEDEVIY